MVGNSQSSPKPWFPLTGSVDNCWVVAGLGTSDPELGVEGGPVPTNGDSAPRGSNHPVLAEEEYNPYDGEEQPSGPLDPKIGAKGLGMSGSVPIPPGIWQKHAPLSLDWAL